MPAIADSRRQPIKQRKYLNKDFEGFYNDLQEYSRTYFNHTNKDLSENSVGGMIVELGSYVGDVLSYYLDHQFQELDYETMVEPKNIERELKNSGVKIIGSSPSVLEPTFYFKIPTLTNSSPVTYDPAGLPYVHTGTKFISESGVNFELIEDLDFTERDFAGNYKFEITIGDQDPTTTQPLNWLVSRKGIAVSGQRQTETFTVGSFEAFKQISLTKENVTEIISVFDAEGNEYFQVESLTHATVFKKIRNTSQDQDSVKSHLEIVPAPYRFTEETSLNTRLTTLTFGGGSADRFETEDDDIIPDPSEYALPLYGKNNLSRFSINPSNLLTTTTLGILTPNTILTVDYRYGGGLSHNIERLTIKSITDLRITFPNNPSPTISSFVVRTADINNLKRASGGEDPLTLDELKQKIPSERAAQARVVNEKDLLARIYKMPTTFGRVFSVSAWPNQNSPLATNLYVVCRDTKKNYIQAPDALKRNLALYLNEYRITNDSIDILDGLVVNLQLRFSVNLTQGASRQLTLQNIIQKLKKYFSSGNFKLDYPISLDDVRNLIYNTQNVESVEQIMFTNITGINGELEYSSNYFDPSANTKRGLLYPPQGGVFEIKYKDIDIIGTST
jgi:hypothetical protein